MSNSELIPKHVAVIMDGNGRWAKGRGLSRIEGHKNGAKTVRMITEECVALGISYLTIFAFSTENWGRPMTEVSALMGLFKRYLDSELENLTKNQVRLRAIGELSKLPDFVQDSLAKTVEATEKFSRLQLVLAVSYGGREEILRATKLIGNKIKRGELDPDSITDTEFRKYLYAPDIPDPDLLIRTSDENRISNFLLWQLMYTEIVVTPVLWPDFSKEDFHSCIDTYSKRNRRFGLTDEQCNLKSSQSVLEQQ